MKNAATLNNSTASGTHTKIFHQVKRAKKLTTGNRCWVLLALHVDRNYIEAACTSWLLFKSWNSDLATTSFLRHVTDGKNCNKQFGKNYVRMERKLRKLTKNSSPSQVSQNWLEHYSRNCRGQLLPPGQKETSNFNLKCALYILYYTMNKTV